MLLETGVIFDLAANLQEWTRDLWNRQTEPCWRRGGVHVDPVCAAASDADGPLYSIRGGSWASEARFCAAAVRAAVSAPDPNPEVGLRCARPGR